MSESSKASSEVLQTLETERLILRKWETYDLDAL